jgi:hypothetical protein
VTEALIGLFVIVAALTMVWAWGPGFVLLAWLY